MNILEKIDEIYKTEIEELSSNFLVSDYYSHISIASDVIHSSCQFVIRKQKKAKLMLIEGKQKVFLSDIDIINTIIAMSAEDVNWFLSEFVDLYQNKYKKILLNINGTEYNGYGMNYYPKEKSLTLFSDTTITFNDFIFLLNFIFSKDYYWGKMQSDLYFSKRTLSKYISIIDYYAGERRSEEYLKNIMFPFEEYSNSIGSTYNKSLTSKIDKLFKKTLLQIDISKYL
ncbi:hypothetical protein SAMN02910317_01201 [Ruminococcaceae bacterium FB2012]|nr:hypothetical protein SAMN02910317_01201 [Ruminococcaceae bacterium FB2012]